MLCPAAALVLLLQHHGQAAHVFVILAIPYLIDMPRIDLGACFAPSGCLLVVTTGSNRPKADITVNKIGGDSQCAVFAIRTNAGGRLCYTSTQRWASCLAEMEEVPLLMVAFCFAPPYAGA